MLKLLDTKAKVNLGERFGRLTVAGLPFNLVQYKGQRRSHKAFCVCDCDCGIVVVIGLRELVSGNTRSCGCWKMARLFERSTRHGYCNTDIYAVWKGMKQRCFNSRSIGFHNYGGRGIAVCQEWVDSPESFIRWALANGYRAGLEIERIDNDGNYEPGNCRWATRKEQSLNKRNNVIVTFKDRSATISEWAKKLGVSPTLIGDRIQARWSVIDALFLPKQKSRYRPHLKQTEVVPVEPAK